MRQKLTNVDTAARAAAIRRSVKRRQEPQKAAFLAALKACGNARDAVTVAALAAGVDRSTPYRWRARDPTFAAAWREITLAQYAELLERVEADLKQRAEARAKRLAELRPIWQQNAANALAAKRRQRRQ